MAVHQSNIILSSQVLNTCCTKSQLSASNLCIRSTPEVITHCAPSIVVTNFNTSLSGSASLQSDGSLSTRCSSASHSSIFTVDTVMGSNRIGRTVNESGLSSSTLDVVQPDLTSTIGEASSDGHSTFAFMKSLT